MNLNEQQKKAVETVGGNLCVIASAGSGKSRCVVERIKNLVDNHNVRPSEILSISFTKQAVTNLEERLITENSILRDVHTNTFHSLAYRLLKCPPMLKLWEQKKMILDIGLKD